jgi:hypothetical protein
MPDLPDGALEDAVPTWWEGRLFGEWVGVNAAAYIVIVLGGATVADLTSNVSRDVVTGHRRLAVIGVALFASALYGMVLGKLQWHVLRQRMPDLPLRTWLVATAVPAFIVFTLVIGPEALDKVVAGSDPFNVYKDAFVQALVLGPLIGVAQAKALQGHSTRWKWWFVANLTSWLFGAATTELATWLLGEVATYPGDSVSITVSPAFPVLAFAIHGLWMLWITAAQATIPVEELVTPARGA